MKIKIKGVKPVPITGEFIKLDSMLKYAVLAESGGEAKSLIQDGLVLVNGQVCMQRGRKLYTGDIVRVEGETVVITAHGEAK